PSGHEMGVDEEVPESVAGEDFLDPGAVPYAGGTRGAGPPPSGALRAPREPDPTGRPPDVAAIPGAPRRDLPPDGRVLPEEGKVSVGRGGGDHFDVAAVLEPSEGTEKIAGVPLHEVPPRVPIEGVPGRGEAGRLPVPDRLELLPVPLGEFVAGVKVRDEVVLEPRRREHLAEDRGEADRDLRAPAIRDDPIEHPQDREVALRSRLEEPVLPVGP